MTFDEVDKHRMDLIFNDIVQEREHQQQLKAAGKFAMTCADEQMNDHDRACVLVEEIGEVCRAILSLSGLTYDMPKQACYADLREELIQVAAVTVAWVEALDKISERAEGVQR